MLIDTYRKCCSIFSCCGLWLLVIFSVPNAFAEKSTGERLYQRCAGCHLSSAEGVSGMFPPLVQRLGPLANTQPGRDYLVMVIQAGLIGSIKVDNVTYQGIMPAQGLAMKEEDVAAVINYLFENFNSNTLMDNWQRFTKYEVATIKSRYPKASGREVHALRQQAFSVKK